MKAINVVRLSLMIGVCVSALGAAPIELRLWPGKAPGSENWSVPESISERGGGRIATNVTDPANGLMRLGWTKRSLKPGDEITVDGFRAKDGSNTANAARVTLADGRQVFAGSSGTPPATTDILPKEK